MKKSEPFSPKREHNCGSEYSEPIRWIKCGWGEGHWVLNVGKIGNYLWVDYCPFCGVKLK